MATDAPAIEVRGLTKSYDRLRAVDGVDLCVPPGTVYGLLGPNGAGKTTTLGCISGLFVPTAGWVRVHGQDVVTQGRATRARVGVVPQELALYEDLCARDNLSFWGAAHGLRGRALRARVQDVLERVGLAARAREPVGRLSGGMKRRLNFACGVVHRPSVLLLDEPTVGVDARSRVDLLELVREEVAAGAAVLYTSHQMQEAEELCDRIAILDHGKIIADGALCDLRDMVGDRDLVRFAGRFEPEAVREALRTQRGVEVVTATAESITLTLASASRRLPALFDALGAAGATVHESTVLRPSLERLFLQLTDHGPRPP